MAFPSSPTDGQVYIKDGVRYVYSSASNSWDIQTDPNKVAGNIKDGVAIDNITGNYDHEATNPITASSMLSGKVGFVNGNKVTGTGDANLVAGNIKSGVTIFGVNGNLGTGLGDLYVTSLDMPLSFPYKNGTHTLQSTYAFVSGNYIYCPVGMYMADDFANNRLYLYIIILSTASTSFPTRTGISTAFQGVTLSSTYLDSGVLYFNLSNNYYYSYTISTGVWSSYISGSHTTGTLLNTALQLNGFQYEPAMAYGNDPNQTVYLDNGLFYPLCKITKL